MTRRMLVLALALSAAAPRVESKSMDQLAFMVGYWRSQDSDGTSEEETWLAEKGNMMLGVHRTVKGLSGFFEFLRIENRKAGITYVAMPRGANSTEFVLVSAKNNEAVFENLAHEFPQRIRYWLADDKTLHAKIESADGKKSKEWAWTREAL